MPLLRQQLGAARPQPSPQRTFTKEAHGVVSFSPAGYGKPQLKSMERALVQGPLPTEEGEIDPRTGVPMCRNAFDERGRQTVFCGLEMCSSGIHVHGPSAGPNPFPEGSTDSVDTLYRPELETARIQFAAQVAEAARQQFEQQQAAQQQPDPAALAALGALREAIYQTASGDVQRDAELAREQDALRQQVAALRGNG